MRARMVLGFALTTAVFVACSSIPDVTFSDNPTNPDGPIANPEGGTDAPVDAVDPNCKSTGPEVCDDGIDNDCNGKIDCADPACTAGFDCFDAPPTGWQFIALTETVRGPCQANYVTPVDVRVVQGNGNPQCSCQCQISAGTACNAAGNFDLAIGPDNTCAAATTQFDATKVNCTAKDFDIPGSSFAKLTPPTGPTGCAASDVKQQQELTDGRTCAPPAGNGKCNQGNQRCLPKPTGYAACIIHTGLEQCPNNWPKQRRTGTSAADTRTCSGCTCTNNPCTGDIELFNNAACNGQGNKITTATFGAACTTGAPSINSKGYKATVAGGCTTATASLAQGAISFGNEQTICCK